jgi:hypothetical protein
MSDPTPPDYDACFAAYENGASATVQLTDGEHTFTVQCADDENQNPMPFCSGLMTINEEFSQFCHSYCAKNPQLCQAGKEQYCRDNDGNEDCRCFKPDGKVFGGPENTIRFDDIKQYVANNDFNFDPRCVWPACVQVTKGAVHPYTLWDDSLTGACPTLNLTCSVSGITVSLNQVTANSINIIDQQCGNPRAPGAGTTTTSVSTLEQMVTAMGPAGMGVAVVAIILVVALAVWLVVMHIRDENDNRKVQKMLREAGASTKL